MNILFGHFQDILFEKTLHLEGFLKIEKKKTFIYHFFL